MEPYGPKRERVERTRREIVKRFIEDLILAPVATSSEAFGSEQERSCFIMQVLTDGELSSETFGTRSGHKFEAGKAGIVVPLRAWNMGFTVVFLSKRTSCVVAYC